MVSGPVASPTYITNINTAKGVKDVSGQPNPIQHRIPPPRFKRISDGPRYSTVVKNGPDCEISVPLGGDDYSGVVGDFHPVLTRPCRDHDLAHVLNGVGQAHENPLTD